MQTDITYIHHVGHVVRNLTAARKIYSRLGFNCSSASYPTLARHPGEPPSPFGAANMHANFGRNFAEVLSVVDAHTRLPTDSRPMPLEVPEAALSRIVDTIEQTVSKISALTARFEGLHVLALGSDDANAAVSRLDRHRVPHSAISAVQRPVESARGVEMRPVRVVEIEDVTAREGRLAIAENPPAADAVERHPNGARDLMEVMLCVADGDLDACTERYEAYIGCPSRREASTRIFDLQHGRVRIVPSSALDGVLPGAAAPDLPAFVGYVVGVDDLQAARTWLAGNQVPICQLRDERLMVPARAALGVNVIFASAPPEAPPRA